MTEYSYIVRDNEGLHARPAGMLVKEAARYSSSITLLRGDKRCDLKRIFAVMGMGVRQGDAILVRAEGEDESNAISALANIMEGNL